jgi:hypothetical protein
LWRWYIRWRLLDSRGQDVVCITIKSRSCRQLYWQYKELFYDIGLFHRIWIWRQIYPENYLLDISEWKRIICKVTEPTTWVYRHNICFKKQSTGKLKICLVTKALNENVQRLYYPLLSIDNICSKWHGR